KTAPTFSCTLRFFFDCAGGGTSNINISGEWLARIPSRFLRRTASPAGLGACSKMGSYFCASPKVGRCAGSGRLLVEANHISTGVTEPRSDLGRVPADRLHDLAPIGDDHVNSGGDAIDHEVIQQAGLRGRR